MTYGTAGSGIDASAGSWWKGQGDFNGTAAPILGVTTVLPFVVGEGGPEMIEVTCFGDTYRTFIPAYGPAPGACCQYCGNRSALRDRRGNCPACGAPR